MLLREKVEFLSKVKTEQIEGLVGKEKIFVFSIMDFVCLDKKYVKCFILVDRFNFVSGFLCTWEKVC